MCLWVGKLDKLVWEGAPCSFPSIPSFSSIIGSMSPNSLLSFVKTLTLFKVNLSTVLAYCCVASDTFWLSLIGLEFQLSISEWIFSAPLVLRNLPSFLQLRREWPPKVGGWRERRSTTWSTLIWKTCKGMPLCRTADAILPILRSTALECGQYERDDKDIAWEAKQWLTYPTIRPCLKGKFIFKGIFGPGGSH